MRPQSDALPRKEKTVTETSEFDRKRIDDALVSSIALLRALSGDDVACVAMAELKYVRSAIAAWNRRAAQPAVKALINQRPNIGASTAEPSLLEILVKYYTPHFSANEAKRLAGLYISALVSAPADQPAGAPSESAGTVDQPVEEYNAIKRRLAAVAPADPAPADRVDDAYWKGAYDRMAARNCRLNDALHTIRDQHIPDQPASYGGSDYDWVVRQYANLRRIAKETSEG